MTIQVALEMGPDGGTAWCRYFRLIHPVAHYISQRLSKQSFRRFWSIAGDLLQLSSRTVVEDLYITNVSYRPCLPNGPLKCGPPANSRRHHGPTQHDTSA